MKLDIIRTYRFDFTEEEKTQLKSLCALWKYLHVKEGEGKIEELHITYKKLLEKIGDHL